MNTISTPARIEVAIALLQAKGLSKYEAYSLYHRFLRWCGYGIRPMHFQSKAAIILLFGIPYSVPMAVIFHFIQPTDLTFALVRMLFMGLFFGGFMMLFFDRRRKKLDLPAWEDIPVSGENTDSGKA